MTSGPRWVTFPRPSCLGEYAHLVARAFRNSAARGDTPRCDIRVFTCQTAHLVPAARLRPGLEIESRTTRGGRSADRRPGAAAPGWACNNAARPGACERPAPMARRKTRVNALMSRRERAPLGAPPWRFSAPVPRFRLRHFLRSSCSDAPRGRVIMPAGRCPVTSRACGYEPQPQDATPRSAYGPSPEDAPR